MKKHLTIIVTGKVQGVGFRRSAMSQAATMKVNGTVRNTSGGAVVMEVEGTEKALDRFVEWCRNGPVMAKVDNVQVTDGVIIGHTGFNVTE
ncbi:MAG: acylphosphatase [Flavobacteriales bacterium]|nr:acylphosphatase [Flavobacteriales bacterium]